MNKLTALAFSMLAFSATDILAANDFTVLTSPEDVLKYSIEDVAGAKSTFKAIIDNSAATDEEKTAAMQTFVQSATPAPGYAFDMTFKLHYSVISADENLTQTDINKYWKCDVEGVIPDSKGLLDIKKFSDANNADPYIRINNTSAFNAESSYDKFALYQTVSLQGGKYQLSANAFSWVAVKCVALAAGETTGETITGNKYLANYTVDFKLSSEQDVKLGFKRLPAATTNLSKIAFNDMHLYKLSPVVVITDDASGALSAASGVDVQLQRTFEAGVYYPICLPFVINDWSEVFEDVVAWNNFADEKLSFATASKKTMARKPYLVKVRENVTEDNYLLFRNVDIQAGNAGSWTKENISDVKMAGNWACGTVPEGCYYLDGNEWKLSDGTAPLQAFSAYMDTKLESPAESLSMLVNGKDLNDNGTSTGIEINVADPNTETVNVYNIQGMIVRSAVCANNALEGLPHGLYIVNGKKIVK